MGLQLSRLERTPDKREVGSSSLLKPTKPDAIASGFFYTLLPVFKFWRSKNSVWVVAFPCVPLFGIIAFIFNMMKNKKTNASTLVLINVLEGIRTPDPRLRRPLLYPTELRTPILLKQAGLVGFEPTNAGIKILCLTAWRQPNTSSCYRNRVDTGIRTLGLQSHNLAR